MERDNIVIQDLKSAIGKDFSDNYSSTLRSILVEVNGKYCVTREVSSPHLPTAKPSRELQKRPSWLIWNMIFS